MSKPLPDKRQQLIRLIHVAKHDLKMDDDSYRAVLNRIAKKSSSSDLSIPQLEVVLHHMKQCGFKVRIGKPSSTDKPVKSRLSRPLADDAESRKIRALWLLLHEIGAVKNPSEEALAAYVERITKVDALQWVSSAQAQRLIESLKKWVMRFLPSIVDDLIRQTEELALPDKQREALESTIDLTRTHRTAFEPMHQAYKDLIKVIPPKEPV